MGQALVSAMLNTIPLLIYENVGYSANARIGALGKSNSKGNKDPGIGIRRKCGHTFHYFYGHDISEC